MANRVLTIDSTEVEGALANLLNNVLPQGIENALEQVCLKVEGDSKENCPSDDGLLRMSITHDIEKQGDTYNGYVGTNVEYAPYVHQGTGIYAADGNGRKDVPWTYKDKHGEWKSTKGMHPTPFIQDSVDSNRQSILEYFKGVLGQ